MVKIKSRPQTVMVVKAIVVRGSGGEIREGSSPLCRTFRDIKNNNDGKTFILFWCGTTIPQWVVLG